MNSGTDLRFDVAVVGGGPAGIAAATVAAESGSSVVLIDDNPGLGGQIWRGESHTSKNTSALKWLARVERSSARWIHSARVFHAGEGELIAESDDSAYRLTYRKLILATGARELFLPFPGWTLPNVMGAGALQAFIKSGLPMNGKRVVVAGTGPLLLAVAAYAREHGADVVGVAEQTTWGNFLRFGLSILSSPGRITDALRFTWQLRGTPYWKNCWPVAALGTHRLEAVCLSRNGKMKEIPCDYLACGFHLVPTLDLARYLGCRIQDGFVAADHNQQTSVASVYCAGEPTGIGGFERSLIEGQIAGYAAAGREDLARALDPVHANSRRHVRALKEAFALREELKKLPRDDTLVCRCEDVPFERLRNQTSWRVAKLQTRCGMGPCQGRVCGSAAEFLFGWDTGSVRPPLFPVRCSSLVALQTEQFQASLHGGAR